MTHIEIFKIYLERFVYNGSVMYTGYKQILPDASLKEYKSFLVWHNSNENKAEKTKVVNELKERTEALQREYSLGAWDKFLSSTRSKFPTVKALEEHIGMFPD